MSHRITKGKGTLEHRLDGKCLSLILEDMSYCIKKSFDFSNNRTYVLKQLSYIKYNLQRRHERMVKNLIGNGFQDQQEKAHLNLEKFYETLGKDRSIIPSTSQDPNLTNQHLEEPSLDIQVNFDNLDSWIDHLLYCPEHIDDIIDNTSQKDELEIEIDEWIEEFINLPIDKP